MGYFPENSIAKRIASKLKGSMKKDAQFQSGDSMREQAENAFRDEEPMQAEEQSEPQGADDWNGIFGKLNEVLEASRGTPAEGPVDALIEPLQELHSKYEPNSKYVTGRNAQREGGPTLGDYARELGYNIGPSGHKNPASRSMDHWEMELDSPCAQDCKEILDLAQPLIAKCLEAADEIRKAVIHQIEVFYYG